MARRWLVQPGDVQLSAKGGFRGIRPSLLTATIQELQPERKVSKSSIFYFISHQDRCGESWDSFERKCFRFRKAQQPAGGAVIGRATYKVGLLLVVEGSASCHWKGVRSNIFKEGLIRPSRSSIQSNSNP